MSARQRFSDEEVGRIAAAVKQAEVSTSGEIVPVIVEHSSEYPEATWKAILAGGLIGLLAYEMYLWAFPGWITGFWTGLLQLPFFLLAGTGVSVLASRGSSWYRRLLIDDTAMDEAVHNRALKAFLEHEVFSTRDRTGILLLVSLFERKVEVFGDSGINEAVAPEDWSEIVAEVVQGIKQNRMTEGLIAGIHKCGLLLDKRGVDILPDDTDELSNQPRFE